MQPPPFEYAFTVRLHDTDAAGLIFFGRLFHHAHDAYEAFMEALGFPLEQLIGARETLLPLTHAEADYRRPLRHGDRVRVLVSVLEIRRRSFAVGYRFMNGLGEVAATARTLHVQVDGRMTPAAALQPALATALATHLDPG